MDIGTILGFVVAIAAVTFAIVTGGGSFRSFVHFPSLVCVLGGGIAAALICFPPRAVFGLPRRLWRSFVQKNAEIQKIVDTLNRLAEVARRQGLLAIESQLDSIEQPFLRRGMRMAVDGLRPEIIEELLRGEMNAASLRHKDSKGILDQIGRSCPAFGMIGTLLGLIIMLGQMSDPAAIGSGMGMALLTTLYGAVAANVIFLPLADKLAYYHRRELMGMELIVKGVLAIQSGEHPAVIRQKLELFLPTPRTVETDLPINIRVDSKHPSATVRTANVVRRRTGEAEVR